MRELMRWGQRRGRRGLQPTHQLQRLVMCVSVDWLVPWGSFVLQDTIGRDGDFGKGKIIVPLLSALTVMMPAVESRRRGSLTALDGFNGFPTDPVRAVFGTKRLPLCGRFESCCSPTGCC